jgi:hypothetical protein
MTSDWILSHVSSARESIAAPTLRLTMPKERNNTTKLFQEGSKTK